MVVAQRVNVRGNLTSDIDFGAAGKGTTQWEWLERIEGGWAFAIAISAVYFALCVLSDSLLFQKDSITSYWPGSALLIFLTLFCKPKSWLKLFPLIFLSNIAFNLYAKNLSILTSAGFQRRTLQNALLHELQWGKTRSALFLSELLKNFSLFLRIAF
jgi:hypothetical protein